MRIARKILRFVLWAVLGLAALIVLAYWEEDWRGARDWAECQKELAARGESLDLRQLCPPGKPEDDLSKVPIFAEVYRLSPFRPLSTAPKATRLNRISIYLGGDNYQIFPKSSSYLNGEPTNLEDWQRYYRNLPGHSQLSRTPAQDVLAALGSVDPEVTEVTKALQNPNAYWPIDYHDPANFSPCPVTTALNLARFLPIRAVAHLENHQVDLADNDYLLSFQVTDSLTKNCLLVNYLVIEAARETADAILWEGVRRHAWSKPQLDQMERRLADTPMLSLAAKGLRDDRAYWLNVIDSTQRWDSKTQVSTAEYPIALWKLFHVVRPKGWWDQDRTELSLLIQDQIDSINLTTGTITNFPADVRPTACCVFYAPFTAEVKKNNLGPHLAQAETHNRLARIACRLEEYWIDHHQYPDRLDELPNLPPHLNQEVLSMDPLHYGRKGDSYVLYSTGWDRKDHGGVRRGPVRQPDGTTTTEELDWTWPGP